MANETVAENPTAPVETESDRPSIDPGQAEKTPTTKAEPAQNGTAQSSPAPEGASAEQPAFDVQKSYGELRKEFTKVTQDYSRDRKTWNQTLTELQALKQSQAQMAELLSKATEQPIDPAQFMQDLQTHGPKAMDKYLQARVQEQTKQIREAYTEQANTALLLEAKLEKLHRKLDTTNYPDFAQLEATMNEIAESEDCPIDWNQPISAIYDALYKLARSRSSEDAVKAAEKFGAAQAEKQLGKEAATSVPGGGKGGSVTVDPRSMTAPQLRQYFISQGMVEDA